MDFYLWLKVGKANGKNIKKHKNKKNVKIYLSGKSSQKLLHHTKKPATESLKTFSKGII